MKFFGHIIKVKIPRTLIYKAQEFAVAVAKTTNYNDSNQHSSQKITDDHFVSKIGEESVKMVFGKYAIVKGPDYGIYHAKEKSWDDDLYINGTGLAVKTQKRSAALRYGLSWTFQAGTFRKDTILNSPNSWVSFVEYNDKDNENACYVYPAFQIHELTFKDPVLTKLKGQKLVVYAKDLKM
jgi:hypothetical protein